MWQFASHKSVFFRFIAALCGVNPGQNRPKPNFPSWSGSALAQRNPRAATKGKKGPT